MAKAQDDKVTTTSPEQDATPDKQDGNTLEFGPAAQPAPADKAPEEKKADLPEASTPPVAESRIGKPFIGRCIGCPGFASCIDYVEVDGKNVAVDQCVKARGLLV